MYFISIIVIFFTAFSITAHADDRYTWVELAAGGAGDFAGTSVNLKMGNDDANWAVELGQYKEIYYIVSHTTLDRNNEQEVSPGMKTIGLTYNWNKIKKLGYLEAGLGLGVAKGIWSSNCTPGPNTGLLSFTDICDISDGIKPGIPLHASAVFGKYVGIGISANAFLTTEGTHLGVMFIIPLGDFTH